MGKLIGFVKKSRKGKREYFQNAEQEIAEKNLILLKTLSLVTIILLLLFYVITPFIITDWVITPQHFLFLPIAFILFVLSLFYQKKGHCSSQFVTGLCLLFESAFFILIILIDVVPYPDSPSTFMPLLCVALPISFIIPFYLNYSLLLFFEGIYIFAVYSVKPADVFQHDVFNSIVGIIFSIIVSQVIMGLRIQDHEVRSKYKELSTQDLLSGILNKQACQEAVENYLALHNPSVTCVLVVLDIDNFKEVNDKMGHYTGDVLLRSIGEELSKAFRSTDIIGRFGGDEFLVLAKHSSDLSALENKFKIMQEKFLQLTPGEDIVPITFSIGGVAAENQNVTFKSLFKQADDALYEAKNSGKNKYILHAYRD